MRDLERLGHAVHWRHTPRQLEDFIRQTPTAQHGRPHGARRDAVDPHPILDVPQRVGARESHDGVLGRIVRRSRRDYAVRSDRGRVDDATSHETAAMVAAEQDGAVCRRMRLVEHLFELVFFAQEDLDANGLIKDQFSVSHPTQLLK